MSRAPSGHIASAEIPAHVPQALVYDFDFHAHPAFAVDPLKAMLDLTEGAPEIFYVPRYGGFWVIRKFDQIRKIAQNAADFSNWPMAIPPLVGRPRPMAPIEIDPPKLTRYRNVLAPLFAPPQVVKMEDTIRQLAVDLIQKIAGQGHADFVDEFAIPFPISMFLLLIGVPLNKAAWLRALHTRMFGGETPADQQAAGDEVNAFLEEMIRERGRNPGTDIISGLIKAKPEGGPFTFDELIDLGFQLFTAGLDTVTNGLGLCWRFLAENSTRQAELRANHDLIPAAADELLRYVSIINTSRRVTRDLEFEGVQMKRDEAVLLPYRLANMDPDFFPDGEEVRFDRKINNHLAFGAGPHRCLGSHLARLELTIALQEWLSRLPPFHIDPSKEVLAHGGHILGVTHLPLAWDVSTKAGD